MYTLHHLKESRSQRIVFLLELLELDYEIIVYKRDAVSNLAPASLKQIHPLGTAPLLSHNTTVVAESGAICEYLCLSESSPKLMPSKDSPEFIEVQFWSHYAEGSFIPHLVTAMVLNKGKEKAPFFVRGIITKFVDALMNAYFGMAIKRNMKFVEQHLQGKTWLVSDNITIADVQMSFPLESMAKAGKLNAFPASLAYVKRVQSHPAYQKAMTKLQQAEQDAS